MVPYKYQDGCLVSVKNAIGIRLRIALKVYILLGGMDILALLILFHPRTQDIIPFICILDFFINVYIFSVAGISSPWLNLFLGILFFLMQL